MRIGLGLRARHFNYLLKHDEPQVGWFEAITENFINGEGAPLHVLTKIRERHPIALHGVALSIGSVDGVRKEHLRKIKSLAERIDPFQVSDHFCFSRFGRRQYHELLPLPLTEAMASRVIANIDYVQTFLSRPLVLENISAYTAYPRNEMGEAEFLNYVAEKSGCKLLLDINNIYVNAANFRFNARRFLLTIDPRHVAQYHLAGFTDLGTHLFDTHGEKIHAPVLTLFREARNHIGERPVSLERDDHIPHFRALRNEMIRTASLKPKAMPAKFISAQRPAYPTVAKYPRGLKGEAQWQRTIFVRIPGKTELAAGHLTPRGVQRVYRTGHELRLEEALADKFSGLRKHVGEKSFAGIARRYIAATVSRDEDLGMYGKTLPGYLEKAEKADLADHARLDLVRFELFHLRLPQTRPDIFSQKVSLSPAIRILAKPEPMAVYREGFSVREYALTRAELAFLTALRSPAKIALLLEHAEKEKKLSATSVKRLFRILGLPGILQ